MNLLETVITPPTAPLSVSKTKIRTPCQPSRPARVTTNDGIFSRVMMVPWKAPIRAQAAMPTMSPAHQTQFCGAPIRAMAMDAPTAPTNPTERSISLRRRA